MISTCITPHRTRSYIMMSWAFAPDIILTYTPLHSTESAIRSTLNRDCLLCLYCFCRFLRNRQSQDTVLIFCFDIFVCQILTDIEASLHCSGITLLTDVFTFLIFLVFIKTLSCRYGQVTVLKFNADLGVYEDPQL